MASQTVSVGSAVGLHARPAALVAEAASQFDDEILLTIAGDDDEFDAASTMEIMAMGAGKGDQVTITSDNAEAVAALAALIEKDLDA